MNHQLTHAEVSKRGGEKTKKLYGRPFFSEISVLGQEALKKYTKEDRRRWALKAWEKRRKNLTP